MTIKGLATLFKRARRPKHLYLILDRDGFAKRRECCGSLSVESNVGDMIRCGRILPSQIVAYEVRRKGKYATTD